jgi:ABC-type Fe3+-hydroxamate transport system substrate-binding protein
VIEVRDDVGRRVALAQPAQRIVSLVPSLTETIFALGAGEAVVGVTRYCTEPVGRVERVERVGGTKNPDLARIRALNPDLVLMNAEENRKEDFEALEQAGLQVFVSFSHRVRAVVELLHRLGILAGAVAAAECMAAELHQALVETERSDAAPRVRVFCPIWKNPWMSFNRDTYADDMLWTAGGLNVCRDRAERYCTVTLEEVAAAQPEVILLPDEPYVFCDKDRASLAPLDDTPAHKAERIHFIDGKALSWYGPRTASALRYLHSLLQPAISFL